MHSRAFLFLTTLLISAFPSSALSDSDRSTPRFTLQVASFPDANLANKLVVQLVNAGEHPLCATVELSGRGYWTRVFVGLFATADAARRYGNTLVGRGIIKEFLVRKADLNQPVTRPRRVTRTESQVFHNAAIRTIIGPPRVQAQAVPIEQTVSSLPANNRPAFGVRPENRPEEISSDLSPVVLHGSAGTPLPVVKTTALELTPSLDMNHIPRPDPVGLAFRLVVGEVRTPPGTIRVRGGLWVTGDTDEGLTRLRWIVGEKDAGLIKLDADGRVQLDERLLAKAAGLRATRVEDPVHVADYISSNEGLLLVIQLAEGRYRYGLHVGRQAPTYGRGVEIAGSINLDNNFDSRINPYRRLGKKLDSERPPEGFDSLVGLNPAAMWFNLTANCRVPVGEITFHELAEAYAKLELGLDYLDQDSRPGAHALALERERRLKSQRPGSDIVLTAGSNRVLRNEQEIRLFFADTPAGVSQR